MRAPSTYSRAPTPKLAPSSAEESRMITPVFRAVAAVPVQVNAVAETLRSQNSRALVRVNANSLPPHIQRAIDKTCTALLKADPTATYDNDSYSRVFFSESDKRTAGYALFLRERDSAGRESIIVIGFDLSGARVFHTSIST